MNFLLLVYFPYLLIRRPHLHVSHGLGSGALSVYTLTFFGVVERTKQPVR